SAWLGLTFASFHEVSVLFMLIGLIWSVLTWLTYQFSSLTIKKKQIVLRTGILVRQTIDVPLSKIESIDIKQSIIGSLLKYGSLVITGTGGTRQSMGYVARPLTCRRHIEQLMYDV
ncbi:MAG: PH domain-containing protein, partial [Gammaproteobacteria bacterium]|nr:PH domain-containing protein [Gammaproteobacteria bacterium]